MYLVVYSNSRVQKSFETFPSNIQAKLEFVYEELKSNPYPQGAIKLVGRLGDYWRLRFGNYRMIYRIDDEKKKIVIVRIGHRSEIYRL